MERQGTVKVVLRRRERAVRRSAARTVTPIPLDAENAHAFLFEGDGKRVLVAMDETHGWTPPDLGPLDLAVLPIGVFEHHPYTGERLIPEEFCKPPVQQDALRPDARACCARSRRARAVLSHVEEMDRLSHDELVRLGAADGWEPAWDGLVDRRIRSDTLARRRCRVTRRLSQRISEGDGIAIIVRVSDAASARAAEEQGAKALAVDGAIAGIRDSTTLPLLWLGARRRRSTPTRSPSGPTARTATTSSRR